MQSLHRPLHVQMLKGDWYAMKQRVDEHVSKVGFRRRNAWVRPTGLGSPWLNSLPHDAKVVPCPKAYGTQDSMSLATFLKYFTHVQIYMLAPPEVKIKGRNNVHCVGSRDAGGEDL